MMKATLDHEDFRLNQSISISMFRLIEIDVMNVIDSKSLARDAGGKPLATFPHPALALAALLLVPGVAAGQETSGPGSVPQPTSLASSGTDPTIAMDAKTGTRYVAFTRPAKSALEVVVIRAADGKNRFSDPVVVSAGEPDIVSSAVAPAQVAVAPTGDVYILYQRRVPSDLVPAGRDILRITRSSNGGRHFSPPVDVNKDPEESGSAMASLVFSQEGTPTVFWLDDREAFARARLPEDQRPKDVTWLDSDDPKIELRMSHASGEGLSFGPSLLVAKGASERSRVSAVIGADGTFYAVWRAKLSQFKGSYDSVRDVVVASSSDGGTTWSSPVKVHDDRFKAGHCPELAHGIGLDANGRLFVAWYTGTSVRPGIYYTTSSDGGKSFSEPVTLLTDSWVPYADVKLATDETGGAWVAFEDRRSDHNEQVVLTKIDANGVPTRIGSWPGNGPDLAAEKGSAMLVWTSEAGGIQALQTGSR
jgi:hypothetical protein